MSYLPIKEIAYALKGYYPNAEETEQIIIDCALVAAGADAVSSILPGLAIPATIAGSFGAVWIMYGRLCKALNIEMKRNVLKLLARAALTNIAANLGGLLLAMTASMFIPGASVAASAIVTFVTVYLAGLIFLKMIARLAEQSKDLTSFSDISEREMASTVHATAVGKQELTAAKVAYEMNKA